jgi:hypothetical protein
LLEVPECRLQSSKSCRDEYRPFWAIFAAKLKAPRFTAPVQANLAATGHRGGRLRCTHDTTSRLAEHRGQIDLKGNSMAKRPKRAKHSSWRSIMRVCCHPVSFTFDLGHLKLTDEMKVLLESAAREQVQEQLCDGFSSGTLTRVIDLGDDGQVELRGWWDIM